MLELQVLTKSISGRVISKKMIEKTRNWVRNMHAVSPSLQLEKETAHRFFSSAIWVCVGGSKQGFMTAAVDPTQPSKFSSNFTSFHEALTALKLISPFSVFHSPSRAGLWSRAAFYYLHRSCLTSCQDEEILCNQHASIRMSPVYLELRHKDVKWKKWRKASWGDPASCLLTILSLFLTKIHGLLKDPYFPLLAVMWQFAGQWDISAEDWAGLPRRSLDSACAHPLPFALCPLWNPDEMLEVKRPPCDSKRMNMRTEAHGTDGSGSCPPPDSLFHRNTQEREDPELATWCVQFRVPEPAPNRETSHRSSSVLLKLFHQRNFEDGGGWRGWWKLHPWESCGEPKQPPQDEHILEIVSFFLEMHVTFSFSL